MNKSSHTEKFPSTAQRTFNHGERDKAALQEWMDSPSESSGRLEDLAGQSLADAPAHLKPNEPLISSSVLEDTGDPTSSNDDYLSRPADFTRINPASFLQSQSASSSQPVHLTSTLFSNPTASTPRNFLPSHVPKLRFPRTRNSVRSNKVCNLRWLVHPRRWSLRQSLWTRPFTGQSR